MHPTRIVYMLRSRIRLLRYASRYSGCGFNSQAHPVTLGPEQLSRFFTFVANSERRSCR
jgi:hypothetical protein